MTTTTIKLTPVYDRSRTVQDWKCPRSRYWNYEHTDQHVVGVHETGEPLHKGIVPRTEALPLTLGIAVHDALATLAQFTKEGVEFDFEDLALATRDQVFGALTADEPNNPIAMQFAYEQATLVEGLIRGYHKHVWPRILGQYPKILFVEEEMKYEHDGLIFMSKPDLVLANEEQVAYVEFKTTSSKQEQWVNSWDTAIQLHSTAAAIKQTHGIDVDAVIIQGLYKGYNSYGRQNSPFAYCYKRAGVPPFNRDEISYTYRSGLKASPVWELPGGVAKWVENMPEEMLTDQFPQTPPIFIKPEMVREFFAQRAVREHEIKEASAAIAAAEDEETRQRLLTSVFPQRFDQCVPSFGSPCPYKRLCHGYVQNPLEEGFAWREPHHKPELDIIPIVGKER